MSKSTTHKPSAPRVVISTGVFAGRTSKRCTGMRWAIGPKHTTGTWIPFALCSVDPAEATVEQVRWINRPHWTATCEPLGKPTPEQAFTA